MIDHVAALLPPITTLAGALGGIWLTQRYQHGRELRDAAQGAYVRWVQFAENLDTWPFRSEARFGELAQTHQNRLCGR